MKSISSVCLPVCLSVCLSVYPTINFLKVGSLIFSDIVHDGMIIADHDIYWLTKPDLKKNNWIQQA